MWRKPLIQAGEVIKRVLTLNTLLVIYGAAAGGYIVINIFIGGNLAVDRTPLQIALGVLVTFVWLLLVFVIIYVLIQGFSNLLIWLGNYYPNWYYFPKLQLSVRVTPKKEIELQIINRKYWQRLSVRVEFYYVEPRTSPSNIRGVAPPDVKELLPLDTMARGEIRTKIIGRVVCGGMILSTGNKNKEVEFTQPGLYDYAVNLSGEFRGRKYGAHGAVSIKITENHEVKTEE